MVSKQNIEFEVKMAIGDCKEEAEQTEKKGKPLNSYNLFFRFQRDRILKGNMNSQITIEDVNNISGCKRYENSKRQHRKTHGKIAFTELSRLISSSWKTLDPWTKDLFENRAETVKREYEMETNRKLENAQIDIDETNAENKVTHELDDDCPFKQIDSFEETLCLVAKQENNHTKNCTPSPRPLKNRLFVNENSTSFIDRSIPHKSDRDIYQRIPTRVSPIDEQYERFTKSKKSLNKKIARPNVFGSGDGIFYNQGLWRNTQYLDSGFRSMPLYADLDEDFMADYDCNFAHGFNNGTQSFANDNLLKRKGFSFRNPQYPSYYWMSPFDHYDTFRPKKEFNKLKMKPFRPSWHLGVPCEEMDMKLEGSNKKYYESMTSFK